MIEDMNRLVTRLIEEKGERAAMSLLLMQLARLPAPYPRADTHVTKILYAYDWILTDEDTNADFTISKHMKIPISTVRNVLNSHRPEWKDEQQPRRNFDFLDLEDFQ